MLVPGVAGECGRTSTLLKADPTTRDPIREDHLWSSIEVSTVEKTGVDACTDDANKWKARPVSEQIKVPTLDDRFPTEMAVSFS